MKLIQDVKKAFKGNDNKKKNDEEDEPIVDDDELSAIGLGSAAQSKSSISIKKDGMYVAHVSLTEVKEEYGSIHEYLKQQYGPGRYTVTTKTKKGERTDHINIAGVFGSGDAGGQLPDNAPPNMMDPSQLVGMLYQMQGDNARLQSEISRLSENKGQSLLNDLVPHFMTLLQTMLSNRSNDSVADVMKTATDCIVNLSSMKLAGSGGGGNEDEGIGSIIGSIAQALGAMRQPQNPIMQPAPPIMQQPITPIVQTPAPPPQRRVETPSPPPQQQQRAEPPTSPPQQPETPIMSPEFDEEEEGSDAVENFMEGLSGMMEQRQSPSLVAQYITESVRQIPDAEIANLDMTTASIVNQMRVNPLLAFQMVCQYDQSLNTDTNYRKEIEQALQNQMPG